MSTPAHRSQLSTVAVPVAVAAVVALAGWLLLLFVKGAVVLTTYVLGGALVVVPLLLARRLVGDRRGKARLRRIAWIAAAVVLGGWLVLVARVVSDHGWLLVVVPAVVVGGLRLSASVRGRRAG